ncbi:MAG: transposase [Bacteroidetes bacterium]|nr:transposase [Bacteroidota bacterium]
MSKSAGDDINWVSTRRSKKDLGKLLKFNIPNSIEGLRLVKIQLPTGEMEILATNILDREIFDIQTMKSLYNLRWGVEEAYKAFKKSIHIEHFTGKSVRAIEQEFYSKIFMLNIASMIRTQYIDSQKKHKKGSQYEQKVNKTQVLAKVKDFLTKLIYSSEILKILHQMKGMLDKCFDIIRPNRTFKRHNVTSRRRMKSMNYKGSLA